MMNADFAGGRHVAMREDWLASYTEAALEPDLPIIDTHQHFYDGWRGRFYTEDDLHADVTSGHNVVATVFMQVTGFNYRKDGDPHYASVGETEYAGVIGRRGDEGDFGGVRLCAGIVAHAELSLGSRVRPILEAHMEAGQGHLRGIREPLAWDVDEKLVPEAGVDKRERMLDPLFQEGVAQLAPLGLSMDVMVYYPQIAEFRQLAKRFPNIIFVINHFGGPLHIGRYADDRARRFSEWASAMRTLAELPNVNVKLGGIGMKYCGFDFADRPLPPSSEALAEAWRPYALTVVDTFGATRCMFESNYPIDKGTARYVVLINTFKRIFKAASDTEKSDIFSRTASRVYRIAV